MDILKGFDGHSLVIYDWNEAVRQFEATRWVATHYGSRVPNVRCVSVIPTPLWI
jgi:hypothetical protein